MLLAGNCVQCVQLRVRQYFLSGVSRFNAVENECNPRTIRLRSGHAHHRRGFRLHLHVHGHQSKRSDGGDQRPQTHGNATTTAASLVCTGVRPVASPNVATARVKHSTADSARISRRLCAILMDPTVPLRFFALIS